MTKQQHTHLPNGRRSHVHIERTDGGALRVPVVEGHILMWPDEVEIMQMRRTKGLRRKWQLGLRRWGEYSSFDSTVHWVGEADLRLMAQAARAGGAEGEKLLSDSPLFAFKLREARDGGWGLWFNGPGAFMHHSLTPQTLDELASILAGQVAK